MMTNRTLCTSLKTLTLMATTLLTSISANGQCQDLFEMEPLYIQDSWPYYTMVQVNANYVSECGTEVEEQSSGVMISEYCILTAGNVVFQNPRFTPDVCLPSPGFRGPRDCMTVIPGSGMYREDGSDWDSPYRPYGSRRSILRSVPSKFTDTGSSFSKLAKVDYGMIRIQCPFEQFNSFMEVRFDYRASEHSYQDTMYGHGHGDTWPSGNEDMVSTARGEMISMKNRRFRSKHYPKAGHVGGCLVDDASSTRAIVGIFSHSSTSGYCLQSTRMCDKNEQLVRAWISWKPSAEQIEECNPNATMPWTVLNQTIQGYPERLIPMEDLNLVDPMVDHQFPPTVRSMQVIEGEFYEWIEYHLEPENPDSARFIEMVSPNPGPLQTQDAMALLSASANWHHEFISATNIEYLPRAEHSQSRLPLAPVGEQEGPDDTDPSPDQEAQEIVEDEPESLPGDLDGDGTVGSADLGMLLSFWGQPGKGDLNGDGTTNAADLGTILANWGSQLP
jgi:hypothetical protein